MGMAASQARLLSITARLSNNENTGQSVSYSKQRLADQTQQITNEYNEALDATKLTVLTSFNGATANYEDISYKLMTGMQMAQTTKQYVVTDTKGKVLVTKEIADAYVESQGDYNRFLAKMGYSQSDLYVNSTTANKEAKNYAEQQIEEAWDKYFETVGININSIEDDLTNYANTPSNEDAHQHTNGPEFHWAESYKQDKDGNYIDKDGNKISSPNSTNLANYGTSELGLGYTYYTYKDASNNTIKKPINYEGTTKESRDLYDYAMAITEAFYRNGAGYKVTYEPDEIKNASDSSNKADIKYYRNLFDKIQQSGFFTYTDTPSKATEAETKANYIYSETTKGTNKIVKNPLVDNYTFEAALRDGTLRLEYYSTADKGFKSTTISEDNCIQEVPDERAIARAEAKYTQDMADLEHKDKQFDLELKKLDTEHNALQIEYESVKNVVDKNVESTFKIFS